MGTLTAIRSNCQEQALRALDSLPPFSPILNRLIATLADEDVSFAKVAALIEKDTVLSGAVLRVVNSAAYNCRGTVNSVAHAIAIMGLTKLRNTALGFSVTRLWRCVRAGRGWSMANFNLHSIASAILADSMAQRAPVHYPEGAFVSGLFHDLGKLLIAVAFPLEYENISAQLSDVREQEALEKELLGVTHADLSALAMERWNLPRPIQIAVAFHHNAASAPEDSYGDCRYNLAQIVAAADGIVNHRGICIHANQQTGEPPDVAAIFDSVGVGQHSETLLRDFEQEYQTVHRLF